MQFLETQCMVDSSKRFFLAIGAQTMYINVVANILVSDAHQRRRSGTKGFKGNILIRATCNSLGSPELMGKQALEKPTEMRRVTKIGRKSLRALG